MKVTRGTCGALPLGIREGGGLRTASTQVWADRFAACSGASEPSLWLCPSAQPRQRSRVASLLDWQFCQIWVLSRWALLAGVEPVLHQPRQGSKF